MGQFLEIKDIFTLIRDKAIYKKDLLKDGLYPVYSSQTKNNGIFGYSDTYNYDGEYISCISSGKNSGMLFLRKGKFNLTGDNISIRGKEIKNKYIYNILSLYEGMIEKYALNKKVFIRYLKNKKIYLPSDKNKLEKLFYLLDVKEDIINIIDKNCFIIDKIIELYKKKFFEYNS